MSESGKYRRLRRIFNAQSGNTIIIPLDDGLIDGPESGLSDFEQIISEITDSKADAILGFKSIPKYYYKKLNNCGIILNLTASTSNSTHTKKTLIGSVENAIRYGVDAVAVHVNISSKYENEMLHNLGIISDRCDKWKMPLVGLMYPRREDETGRDCNYCDLKKTNPREYAKLIRHAVKIGVDLGVDVIKTQYTGTPDTFQTVIQACQEVPVIIAGGPKSSIEAILKDIHGAIAAGARGCCIGRNAFNRKNTKQFIDAIFDIVHNAKDYKSVLSCHFMENNNE